MKNINTTLAFILTQVKVQTALILKSKRSRLVLVILLCGIMGCSDSGLSNSSENRNDYDWDDDDRGQPDTGAKGKSCGNYKPIPGAYDGQTRHIYLGEFRLDKNSGPQGAYRAFLGDFAPFCINNTNGFKWQYSSATGRMEYAKYYAAGQANCSQWDDFFKLWIVFPRNDSRRAHLVVDATMSGYPNSMQGQGYDIQRVEMANAQIDCSNTEDTVIYYEPYRGFQFRVKIYQGDKSSERMRAEVFYKNVSIGKSDFFIIQR